jgi:DNA-binding transcriptional regulator YiaG
MFPDEFGPDHAAQTYENSQTLKITFTISKYPSETLGQFLRKLRLEKRLEQGQLAKKLRGHRNTVYEWESGRRRPSGRSMGRLVKFLRISRKTLEDFKMERKRGFRRGNIKYHMMCS